MAKAPVAKRITLQPIAKDKVHDKKSGTGIDSPNLQGNADFEASKSKPASND